ncbi:hypothetical protein [Helicobacter sp. 23-1045]
MQKLQDSALDSAKIAESTIKHSARTAFTMIELIFSIVIVGFIILSIPLIVRQSSANTMMSQNVIGYYNALTLMETIKSKPWDKENVDDFQNSGVYYILNTGNTATDCKQVAVEKFINGVKTNVTENIMTKKGLANANKRRMCDPNTKVASFILPNFKDLNSINDFHTYEIKVKGGSERDKNGNVTNLNNEIFALRTEVAYKDFGGGDGNSANAAYKIINPRFTRSDIKEIKIELRRIDPNGGNELSAVFTYYATNIGTDIPLIKDNTQNP